MRYIFQTAGGIGNQIQLVPAYLHYLERYPNLDVVYVKLTDSDNDEKPEFFKILSGAYGNYMHIVKRHQKLKFDTQIYRGMIACRHHYFKHNLENVLEQTQPHTGNEVDYNNQCMGKKRAKDIMTKQIPLDWFDLREREAKKKGGRPTKKGRVQRPEHFDVVICNGGYDTLLWAKKKYQRWNEVAESLKAKGYKVASVGTKDEYIQGCEDYTDIGIVETMDMIANCSVFASNDTGWSHFACVVGVKNVIAYTATNIKKNFNEIFHRYGKYIRPECEYFPCQSDWNLSSMWSICEDWKCTYYDPSGIIKVIEEKLNEA